MVIFYTQEQLIAKEIALSIDINFLSAQLLERLANSIHDRDSNFKNFCFSISEVQVTEQWIDALIKELLKEMA